MKISGFTFVRNAGKLYYPVKQSILSILPIVDEFVVAVGNCDTDDTTESEIASIGSDKIKIIRTQWDLKKFPNGMEYAHQTDIAMKACVGDWLFYIQSDEVIHERFLPIVKGQCEKYYSDHRVEGLVFNFQHFWGDFNHYVVSHVWYPKEIRVVRNTPQVHSWRDAQSFRNIVDFDGLSYNSKRNTRKLSVVPIEATVYHYGFVRPPRIMQKKVVNHVGNYKIDPSQVKELNQALDFNYGDLSKLPIFYGSHPEVMRTWVSKFDWGDDLKLKAGRSTVHKHNRLKYRLLTFIEQNVLSGRQLFGFKNYKLIDSKAHSSP